MVLTGVRKLLNSHVLGGSRFILKAHNFRTPAAAGMRMHVFSRRRQVGPTNRKDCDGSTHSRQTLTR